MAEAGTGPSPDDEAALARHAAALADGVEAALPRWVERVVVERVTAYRGEVAPEIRAEAAAAGERARAEVGAEVRALLERDVDDQPTGPLAVLRRAVAHPTAVLRRAGIPPVERDEFAERAFPDDVYDLSPAAFADLDPELHEPGIVWGAAKAHVHLARRRAEGRR
jgi:hypothetical protein